MTWLFRLLSPLALSLALAVHQPAQANPDLLRDFDFATSRLETSYGGWETKTAGARGGELKELTARLRAEVASGDKETLRRALTAYIAWFDDGHVQLNWQGVAVGGRWPARQRTLTETQARQALAALGDRRAKVEGIWTIDDSYRLAVVRSDRAGRHFDAVVLSTSAEGWRAGDVKATVITRADGKFDVRYGWGDRTEGRLVAHLTNDGGALVLNDGGVTMQRVYDSLEEQEAAERRWPSDQLGLSRVDPSTLRLRIPSMGVDQRQPLEALLRAHASELRRTPFLIVDIRNNGGGSDLTYDPVIDLLFTRPITKIGTEMRVSSDNIRLLRGLAAQVRPTSPDISAEIMAVVGRMERATSPYVLTDIAPFEIIGRAAVLPSPRRVALLIDNAASSAEHLILAARQSDKVVLMGQANSAGVLDFGNVVGEASPSGLFSLAWATSRSLRLPGDPVDPTGIAPQIRIPPSADPVRFAAEWLAARDRIDEAANHVARP